MNGIKCRALVATGLRLRQTDKRLINSRSKKQTKTVDMLMSSKWTSLACTFCFPISDHVMLLQGKVSFKFRLLTCICMHNLCKNKKKKEEKDYLRSHWRAATNKSVNIYRFTRALFGLTCSPFLLGGVLEQHPESWEERKPKVVTELRKSFHLHQSLIGGLNKAQVQKTKDKAVEIIRDATFTLHKWNSNVPVLEMDGEPPGAHDESQSYANQQLEWQTTNPRYLEPNGTMKGKDTLSVVFPSEIVTTPTKRVVLGKIYNP